jgi:hypothetical protein
MSQSAGLWIVVRFEIQVRFLKQHWILMVIVSCKNITLCILPFLDSTPDKSLNDPHTALSSLQSVEIHVCNHKNLTNQGRFYYGKNTGFLERKR